MLMTHINLKIEILLNHFSRIGHTLGLFLARIQGGASLTNAENRITANEKKRPAQ